MSQAQFSRHVDAYLETHPSATLAEAITAVAQTMSGRGRTIFPSNLQPDIYNTVALRA